jgi:hypothetical protein
LLLLVVVVVAAAAATVIVMVVAVVVVVMDIVICLTPWKEPLYPLKRRFGGPPVLVRIFHRTEKSLAAAGIRNPQCPAHSLAIRWTTLPQLLV